MRIKVASEGNFAINTWSVHTTMQSIKLFISSVWLKSAATPSMLQILCAWSSDGLSIYLYNNKNSSLVSDSNHGYRPQFWAVTSNELWNYVSHCWPLRNAAMLQLLVYGESQGMESGDVVTSPFRDITLVKSSLRSFVLHYVKHNVQVYVQK